MPWLDKDPIHLVAFRNPVKEHSKHGHLLIENPHVMQETQVVAVDDEDTASYQPAVYEKPLENYFNT